MKGWRVAAAGMDMVRFTTSAGRNALLVLVVAGCGIGDHSKVAQVRAVDGCESRAGWSRWASGQQRIAAVSAEGQLGGWAGLTVVSDRVYVFDPSRPGVWVLNRNLAETRWLGRGGAGPGELGTAPAFMYGPRVRWIDARGDTLVVYDGQRASLFNARTGAFVAYRGIGGLSESGAVVRRLQMTSDAMLFDTGDYEAPDGAMTIRRRRVVEDTLWRVSLPPPPRRPGGGIVVVPNQAVPLWAAEGGCVVASDGAGARLIRVSTRTGAGDTLPLPSQVGNARSGEDPGSFGGRPLPAPTLAARIRALVLDPDGYAWIRPVAPARDPAAPVIVLVVSVATGEARWDTVPAFPATFEAPGSYFGVRLGADGAPQVVRVDTDTAPSSP